MNHELPAGVPIADLYLPELSSRDWDLLVEHRGLRATLRRSGGASAYLRERGWRRDECGAQIGRHGTWQREGLRRSLSAAIAHQCAQDVAAWLQACGWKTLPDGSSAKRPTRAGLTAAARIEHSAAKSEASA